MGTWSKPKRISNVPQAYATYPVGPKYGVALYRIGARPEWIKSIALRPIEDRLQKTVDRLNSRIGVTKDQAAKILFTFYQENA